MTVFLLYNYLKTYLMLKTIWFVIKPNSITYITNTITP